jgi:hypothetical protein
VEVSHRAVLAEEWPKVIDCALQQEYAWSQYRRIEDTPDKPYDHTHLHWTRAKRRPDSVLVALAAKAIAAGVVPEFKPGLIAGHPFGEEIPEPVLTELALLGYMRFSKSLIASAPNAKVRDKLQSNPLHQWVGGRVLPSLYYWTRLRRTRPDLVIVLNTIPPVAGLTILLLDVLIVFHVFGLAAPLELKVAMFLASAILFLLWWWSLRKQG